MSRILLSLLILNVLNSVSFAQETGSSPSLRASKNKFNPEISVIGWGQVEAGRRNPASGESDKAVFQFKEAELGLQSNVDAYGRAEVYIAFGAEGTVELEEGFMDWTALPHGLGLKFGKFRSNFGKFNRVHGPETDFGDRPLVHKQFFGDESLHGVGASLSWQIPNPAFYTEFTSEVQNSPEAAEIPAFDTARKRDLLYVNRLHAYHDLNENLNATLGTSFAYGAVGQDYDTVALSSRTMKNRILGTDLTFRWKNTRKAIYRSAMWQTEALWSKRDVPGGFRIGTWGMFSHVQYQFARRWKTGFRYDYTQLPTDGKTHEAGGLAYITFTPSEFSLLSLQARRARRFDGDKETVGWLKVTFNIGPHGSHPF